MSWRHFLSFTFFCLTFFFLDVGGQAEFLHLDDHWEEFKSSFNKTYSKLVESLKRSRWEENIKKIHIHNEEALKGLHNYTLRPNYLADLSAREYLTNVITLMKSHRRKVDKGFVGVPHLNPIGIPEEIDYRKKGFVTRAFNQRSCGSCYAFSVAAAVQAQNYLKNGIMKEMSVQQIIDCSITVGNLGCDGGSLSNTLRYLQKNELSDAILYPYLGQQGLCKPTLLRSILLGVGVNGAGGVKVETWGVLPARDEISMAAALAEFGPLPVSINASPYTFQFYHSGIYDDRRCSSDSVNHAMLLVGYTRDAWILQNWWSEEWGDKGYMYLKRWRNLCGIANYAAHLSLV